MLIRNPQSSRTEYPDELKAILSMEAAADCRTSMGQWSHLRQDGTPLWQLPGLASRFGIAQLAVKDESFRSDLGSFKALGAPAALICLLRRLNPELIAEHLLSGRCRQQMRAVTVISATDGNHGRALAAAAQSVGCNCVIVLHAKVSKEREEAISAFGATIVRIDGNYDDSVNTAARMAADNGWHVVSDTSYEGYEAIPRDVMQGYGTIAAEVIEQLQEDGQEPFTHVFLQGGVGGLAAGFASYFWEYYGKDRPRFVVVEPEQADCLYRSALAGAPCRASGSVDSVMAGLACGEASPLAWKILAPVIDDFMTVCDVDAVLAMQALAKGSSRDVPIVAGESGAAGLAGLQCLLADEALAKAAGLGPQSRVLLINTEGATARQVYERLVSEPAESVARRQAVWLSAVSTGRADTVGANCCPACAWPLSGATHSSAALS